jgi:hypothetical protein
MPGNNSCSSSFPIETQIVMFLTIIIFCAEDNITDLDGISLFISINVRMVIEDEEKSIFIPYDNANN